MKESIVLLMMLFFSSWAQAAPSHVAITSPDDQSTSIAGSDITLTARASEVDGSMASVAFYDGTTLLGQSIKSPYSYVWNEVPAGTHILTAVATDTDKFSIASSTVTITVTPAPPAVAITSPADNTTYTAGSNISLGASASEFNGTISTVSFYNGTTLLSAATKTTSSYNYTWDNVPAGTYALTAVATDTKNISTTSAPVAVTVTPSSSPVIAVTSPFPGSSFTAGSSITLTAAVSEKDATVRDIYFFDGSFFLGSTSDSPYTYTWTYVPAGTHSLTAEATDSNGGTLISAPVDITINPAPKPVKTPPVKKSSSPSSKTADETLAS